MIEVRPSKNQEEIEEVFEIHGAKLCEGAMSVKAIENGKVVGSAIFSLVGTELTLISVIYPKDDIYVCDLVSRGVMNYGVNRGAMYCNLAKTAPKSEFLAFGFIENINETSINIIRTFTMCTNCKKNK